MTTQITLPRDAEGREIPLDTMELYDEKGNEWGVLHVEYSPHTREWKFSTLDLKGGSRGYLYAEYAYLEKPTPPDSWEKLLDDLDHAADISRFGAGNACCYWFNDNRTCVDCPADESPDGDRCTVKLFKDIAARIRKLRGEDDANHSQD